MKLIVKTLRYILASVLVLICAICVYVLAAKLIFKQKNPKVFGYSVMVVKTGSMYPELKPDDLIIIKTKKQYKSNDIITFEDGNSFTTHRIIEIAENGFITKGDANEDPDNNIVEFNKVEGKVIGKVGGVGKVVKFVTSSYGLICIIFTIVIVVITGYVINIIKKRNN